MRTKFLCIFPAECKRIGWMTLLAITRTSASSSFGSGRCTCSILSTSGAQNSWATTARIFGFASARVMQTAMTPRAVKLQERRVDRADCIGHARARSTSVRTGNAISHFSTATENLAARIDEDLPALDALQFENAVFHPRIVFEFFSNFAFVICSDDQH
jgi:hypothetical protein